VSNTLKTTTLLAVPGAVLPAVSGFFGGSERPSRHTRRPAASHLGVCAGFSDVQFGPRGRRRGQAAPSTDPAGLVSGLRKIEAAARPPETTHSLTVKLLPRNDFSSIDAIIARLLAPVRRGFVHPGEGMVP
jgi:hypothetical protein